MTSSVKIDCEFHCHTSRSHDGFTSYQDLIEECQKKEIGAVTITEHDVLRLTDSEKQLFVNAGIQLIPGCEMTSNTGAHIIGLFIETALSNRPAPEIVDHILGQGGLVYIPHPFKADSGLLWTQPVDSRENRYVMSKAHLIELYNGGWDSADYRQQIRELAQAYDMCMVAGSDSHKAWHVGLYKTRLTVSGLPLNAEKVAMATVDLLVVDTAAFPASGKQPNAGRSLFRGIQKKKIYQSLIRSVPFLFKRKIKELSYSRQLKKHRKNTFNYKYISLS